MVFSVSVATCTAYRIPGTWYVSDKYARGPPFFMILFCLRCRSKLSYVYYFLPIFCFLPTRRSISATPELLEPALSRGRTLRVRARNGQPPNFGARTLPYPPGNAILTTGYPGTRFFAVYRVPGHIVEVFSHNFSATKNEIYVEDSVQSCVLAETRSTNSFYD